jgi:4-coumarate--CoA ligase (photoactive yellow protein activation family)
MMPELLAAHAPADPVCFGGPGARNAGQLLAFARRIAAALPAQGDAGRVVVACRDRYYFMASLLAALERGLQVTLPVNVQPETVRSLGSAPDVVALLHDQPGQAGLEVAGLEQPEQQSGASFRLPERTHEPSIMLFTSGSSGVPEPHSKALAQLVREANAHVIEFALQGCRYIATVPAHHIYGLLFSVLAPLLGGGSVLRQTPLFPRELCAAAARYDAQIVVSVPPQLFALAQDKDAPLPRLARVFSSAGPLAPEVHAALAARGLLVTEILGSTETGGIAFREQPQGVWRPLRQVQVSIDASDTLCVDSPWLAADAPRPLRTADRAELAGEGFRHLGRADAVVKVGGRRIDLGDLESCLRAQPGVREARVLAVQGSGARGTALWAAIEGDPQQLRVADLRAALAARFDPVTLPRRYRIVDRLPRAESGKLTRSALLALFDVWEFSFEAQPDGAVRVPVPHETGFVRGHFEGDPILPGVVQLNNIALAETRRRYPELGSVERVTRVKFKRIVLPGEVLLLTIERKAPLQVQFAMRVGPEPACSGIFHFRAPAPGPAREGEQDEA